MHGGGSSGAVSQVQVDDGIELLRVCSPLLPVEHTAEPANGIAFAAVQLLWRLRLLVLLRLLLVLLLLQWLLVLLRLEGRLLLRCLRVGRICARSSTRHMSYRAQHLHSVQGMQGLGRTLVLRRAAHALRTTGGLLRHLLLRLVVLPLLLLLIHARPRCSRWAGVANSHIRSVIC